MAAVKTQSAFNSYRPSYSEIAVVSFIDGDGALHQTLFHEDYSDGEAADLHDFTARLDELGAQYAVVTIHCD